MKNVLFALVLVVAGCATHAGTLKAVRKDFVQLRKELKAGELKVVKYKDEAKNKVATEDWIDLADIAIENIDTALGDKADGVAPVTSKSR